AEAAEASRRNAEASQPGAEAADSAKAEESQKQEKASQVATVTPEEEPIHVTGKEVLEKAEAFLGAPYRYGGTTPKGVDCSGLIYSVFRDFGIALPRTTAHQSEFGTHVRKNQLQPGDLIFFRTTAGAHATHVGIYAGNGRFIHASPGADAVKFDRLDSKYFRRRYGGARRVL
ncbi:MAG: C40 family peptidase, partial [Candidatus Krumholzibacteriota bacterium]|nr:C40 family peptidase [Candidatus Krumholzibacteriota bacterium]